MCTAVHQNIWLWNVIEMNWHIDFSWKETNTNRVSCEWLYYRRPRWEERSETHSWLSTSGAHGLWMLHGLACFFLLCSYLSLVLSLTPFIMHPAVPCLPAPGNAFSCSPGHWLGVAQSSLSWHMSQHVNTVLSARTSCGKTRALRSSCKKETAEVKALVDFKLCIHCHYTLPCLSFLSLYMYMKS